LALVMPTSETTAVNTTDEQKMRNSFLMAKISRVLDAQVGDRRSDFNLTTVHMA
jgi:hypothetical protein